MSEENEERAGRAAGAGRVVRSVPWPGWVTDRGQAWGRVRRRGGGVAGAVVGCFVLGGVLMVVPTDGGDGRDGGGGREARVVGAAGAEGRRAGAVAAAGLSAGVPAALPDVVATVLEREARVRARPGDHVSWAVLGVAYVERARRTGGVTDYPRAERALRTSLRLRPGGNADAFEGLTALAVARRDFRAAERWGEEAVRVAPGRWTSYALLIDAYDGLGRYKAARATRDRMLAVDSGPAARARAARVSWDQGAREDAAAALSDAAAAETSAAGPSAAGAAWWVRAGELAWERGDAEHSLRYCEAGGSGSAGGEPEAGACRARALVALGRTAEGVRAYRAALARRPSAEVALRLGELYESLGRPREARKQWGVVRTLVARSAAAGVNESLVLGALEADHGDPAEAVRVLRAEWERQPGLRVADALGWALHRAGRDGEALGFARRATDRARGGEVRSAVYAYHRGVIERAVGLEAAGRRHLEEARRLNPYGAQGLYGAVGGAL